MMDFYDVVAQVAQLLQRQGRVTYRGLKRHFDLDDDFLEDVKDEIIKAQQLAVDENGEVLIWTGDAESTPPMPPAPPSTPRPAPLVERTELTHVETPPVESRAPEAERRQLTVLFCDLVESTALSGRLDPEDLRDVIRSYQAACAEVIKRFDGHVAQLLGDGLLVYLGYPQAHEDDAQRAVRAGLGMLEAMRALNARLQGAPLAIRVGIHTGLVVVGEMGGEGRQEQLALGEAPNIAARLQGLAEPNTVVMSAATSQLVQGFFHCEDLGEQHLRGVAHPIKVHRVLQETGAQSRLDIASARGLTPLVGRESEVSLLLNRWEQAKNGSGQAVLLSGEAGIGKSRLVQALKEHVASRPHTRLECRSSPYYQSTALYPIANLLQDIMRWEQDDATEAKWRKLEGTLERYDFALDETAPLFATLLSLPVSEDRYPPANLTPQRQRQKTLETLVAMFVQESARDPVLFIVEDLHWTDPTTLAFLDLLMDQSATASILMLLTCRPEFELAWSHRSSLAEVDLNRLSHRQIELIATQVAGGKTLPAEIIQQLIDKTDGVPLYVEEMTKAVLESGVLKEKDGRYALTGVMDSLTIPVTLQDSLMARLDRLVTAKGIAQYASVLGRQFSYELLQSVLKLDEETLRRELTRLVESELVYQQGIVPQAVYTFKHALIQDTAYASLLRRTREQAHQQVANVLENELPETADTQPELLAYHFTEAGLHEKAINYWRQAGQKAMARSANIEVISHLTKGLELLKLLPGNSDRHRQELDMNMALAPALMGVKGSSSPEAEDAYGRALALCEQLDDTDRHFHILWGQRRFYSNRGDHGAARALGKQLLELARSQNDPARLVAAHVALGGTLTIVGNLRSGLTHLEQALDLLDAEQQRALGMRYGLLPWEHALAGLTTALWLLGYPEQALQRSREACAVARELDHVQSLAHALHFTAQLHVFRREPQATFEYAQDCLTLSTEQGFSVFAGLSGILKGWALFKQDQTEVSMAQMRQSMTLIMEQGHGLGKAIYLSLLADVYHDIGQDDEGLRFLAEAQVYMETSGECYYEAEIYRLKGDLLLAQSVGNQTEAETYFQQAISVAQTQSAKSLELRAATGLARLWQSQGKGQEAHDLLAPVYGWFTEGFDTADLQDAKTLLNELSMDKRANR